MHTDIMNYFVLHGFARSGYVLKICKYLNHCLRRWLKQAACEILTMDSWCHNKDFAVYRQEILKEIVNALKWKSNKTWKTRTVLPKEFPKGVYSYEQTSFLHFVIVTVGIGYHFHGIIFWFTRNLFIYLFMNISLTTPDHYSLLTLF